MAAKLTDSKTATAIGAVANTLNKFPEGGCTFGVQLSAGTAVVQVRAWTSSTTAKEVLATFTLPIAANATFKANDLFDDFPVFTIWDNWDWNVVDIQGGGTLTLKAIGVGV